MKNKIKQEYYTRVKKVLRSQLNSGHMTTAINAWAVAKIRYGAGILQWTKEEAREMDRKTRKILTMNKALHPRADIDRLYVPRKLGGRGLINIEECIEAETQGLADYIQTLIEERICHTSKPWKSKQDRIKERMDNWHNRFW